MNNRCSIIFYRSIKLIQGPYLLTNQFEIRWSWVKAHSTDKLNNEVDLIARESANSK